MKILAVPVSCPSCACPRHHELCLPAHWHASYPLHWDHCFRYRTLQHSQFSLPQKLPLCEAQDCRPSTISEGKGYPNRRKMLGGRTCPRCCLSDLDANSTGKTLHDGCKPCARAGNQLPFSGWSPVHVTGHLERGGFSESIQEMQALCNRCHLGRGLSIQGSQLRCSLRKGRQCCLSKRLPNAPGRFVCMATWVKLAQVGTSCIESCRISDTSCNSRILVLIQQT